MAADRLDHAAHAGDAAAITYEEEDVAAAVHVALAALAGREDATVIVAGDHVTKTGTVAHSDDAVPVLVYGSTAQDAVQRATGSAAPAAPAFWPPPAGGPAAPAIPSTDFPLLLPYFRRECGGATTDGSRGWVVIPCAGALLALAAVLATLTRRKRE